MESDMRVLAITNQFPLPLDMGGPLRFFGLARALAADHEVHLLALRRGNTTDALVTELASMLGGPVETFPRPRLHTGGRREALARWARAGVEGLPPWVSAEASRDLERRALNLASDADAVVLLDDYAGVYASTLAAVAPVVADKSNVLGWTASQPGASETGTRARARRSLSAHLARRFERGYTRHASAVVVTSEEEERRFEALYGRRPDAVVPSGVDLPPPPLELPESGAVGWLGTHRYEPNVEGLLRFAEEGWEPLGRQGFRLLIPGGNPPPRVRALGRLPGVEVLGFVEDLDHFLRGLAAAVVPLWTGAGVKLKTLTFMGAGIPTAATPTALEGMEAEPGRHCLASNDPVGLSEALRDILVDRRLARELGENGRRLVAESFTWPTIGPRFVRVVERAAAART